MSGGTKLTPGLCLTPTETSEPYPLLQIRTTAVLLLLLLRTGVVHIYLLLQDPPFSTTPILFYSTMLFEGSGAHSRKIRTISVQLTVKAWTSGGTSNCQSFTFLRFTILKILNFRQYSLDFGLC